MKEEEFELYSEFKKSEYLKPTLLRLSIILKTFEKKILSIDLNSTNAEKELYLAKAEFQGAQKLLKAFESDLTSKQK